MANPYARPARSGFGLAALVLGIVAVLMGASRFAAPIGILAGLLAVIFGAIGLRHVSRRRAANRGQALAGLVLGVVGAAVSAVMTASLIAGFFDGGSDGGSGTTHKVGASYAYDDGFKISVAEVARQSDGTHVTVKASNGTGGSVDLSEFELTAGHDMTNTAPGGEPAPPLPGGKPLPRTLADGGSATGEYVFKETPGHPYYIFHVWRGGGSDGEHTESWQLDD